MAAIDFFGYLFLALGPAAAFYGVFIAPKSFVVLLSIFSAFFWLVVLLLTSAVFRGGQFPACRGCSGGAAGAYHRGRHQQGTARPWDEGAQAGTAARLGAMNR
jgi:hypothetical protein